MIAQIDGGSGCDKELAFRVRIEGLPPSCKDYRVAGSVCHGLTKELRGIYGDQVNVIVDDVTGKERAAS